MRFIISSPKLLIQLIGKIFIEYEPLETASIPISGKNYEYIYCLWVAGNFKGIGKELLDYHHKTDMMKEIAKLRERYNLKMKIERYIEENKQEN